MGTLWNQYDRLAKLVAASPTFQALVGATGLAQALERVHFPAADEATACWPRAVITPSSDWRKKRNGVGTFSGSGGLYLTFDLLVPDGEEATTDKLQLEYVLTQLDAVTDEMLALARTDTGIVGDTQSHLNLNELELVDGPWQDAPDERPPPDSEAGEVARPRWWMQFLARWMA